ncbi:hypothetical protein ACIG87_11930 [Micromonospora sp. NPDC051925]|uniref:hypothetical protein n=1 Tax=Micromonospora sp. NPDC051925 TaxID=3364288 RepID=UPI0037CBA8B5
MSRRVRPAFPVVPVAVLVGCDVPVPPSRAPGCVGRATGPVLTDAVARPAGELAAVTVEPVVRGTGLRFRHPGRDIGGRPDAARVARHPWATRWPVWSSTPSCGCYGRRLGRRGGARVGTGLRTVLEPLRGVPGVADVRVRGAFGGAQLDHEVDVAATTAAAMARSGCLRPLRDLVHTVRRSPTGDADVARSEAGIAAAVESAEPAWTRA